MRARPIINTKIKTNQASSKINAACTIKDSGIVDACNGTDDLIVKKYVDACTSTDDLIVKNHVDACTSTDDVCTNENEPCTDENEPCTNENEPCTIENESIKLKKEALILKKNKVVDQVNLTAKVRIDYLKNVSEISEIMNELHDDP